MLYLFRIIASYHIQGNPDPVSDYKKSRLSQPMRTFLEHAGSKGMDFGPRKLKLLLLDIFYKLGNFQSQRHALLIFHTIHCIMLGKMMQ